ncbi:N-acetyltransferase [Arcicella sp. DC2W]|uniref:N-acetyltransferase n=1 Tax=Arcicella gelida TaxID=2984195 RepID=A0ABU5RYV3_9BACT|nr:N-acetyltransferase [Arcicella sp. DC2W]MEA5401375.1 N-acetyltransferase [Arcicella sp. DC2W]
MKIITIHGIRREKRWYNDLKNLHIWSQQKIEVIPFEYGYFSLFQFLLPWKRKSVYNKFLEFYKKNVEQNEPAPSLVCHSFGTLIFFNCLNKHSSLKFDNVILCGSIVDPHLDWDSYFKNGQIKRVKNDYGIDDWVVNLSSFVIKNCGASGKNGFENIPQSLIKDKKFIQERNYFNHSDYFYTPHMEKNWVKFLLEGSVKFNFRKDILRDDIIERIYENEKENDVEVSKIVFKSRVDFFKTTGNYYGSYTMDCINKQSSILNWYRITTTADSIEDAKEMGFSAFVNNQKAQIELEDEKIWKKNFKIGLLDGIQPEETFNLNYRFTLRNTMNKRGDTDHYLTKNIKYVDIYINFKETLTAPTFIFIKNQIIIHSIKAQKKNEKDNSITYWLNHYNEQNFDGIIFYYEGIVVENHPPKVKIPIQNMKDYFIESCSEQDIKHIYAIESKIEFENGASEATLLERRKMFNQGFLVLKKGNKILGYIETTIWKYRDFESFDEIKNFPVFHNSEGDTLYVIFLAIDEYERLKGYGSALLKAVENTISQHYNINKIVLVAKDGLVKFYKNNGYKEVKELPHFLKNRNYKSVLMEKNISNNSKNKKIKFREGSQKRIIEKIVEHNKI